MEEDFIDEVYVRNWQESNGHFLEKILSDTIQKAVLKIDAIIETADEEGERKYIDEMLKPPTKAEIRELKEYRRKMNAKLSPGGKAWLDRIQKEQREA